MTSYPFEEWTTVVIPAAISNLAAPTVAELIAALDITRELTRDGLDITKATRSTDRTPWAGSQEIDLPHRYAFTSRTLKARRHKPGTGPELLLGAAVLRTTGFLAVRSGYRWDSPFEAGQEIDTYAHVWGEPTPISSTSNTVQQFTVELFITAHVARTRVAA